MRRRRGWERSAVDFEGTTSLPLDSSPPVSRLMARRQNAKPHNLARRVFCLSTPVSPSPSNPISTTHLRSAEKSTKKRHPVAQRPQSASQCGTSIRKFEFHCTKHNVAVKRRQLDA